MIPAETFGAYAGAAPRFLFCSATRGPHRQVASPFDCIQWGAMAERGGGVREIATAWPPRGSAPAGGFAPAALDLWASFTAKLRSWVRAEAGAGRLLPWVPVAFGAGIAVYFSADHEPQLAVAIVTALVLCVAAFLLRRSRYFSVLVLIAAAAAGFAAATFRTASIAHTVLERRLYAVSLSGFVEARDIRERTDRFVL